MSISIERLECWLFRAHCPYARRDLLPVLACRRYRLARAVYAEVLANPNPQGEEVFPFEVSEGWVTLTNAPGLGVEPDLQRLARLAVQSEQR